MIKSFVESNRVSNHSILNEISRKNLVGKTKSQSPQRYNRRLGYKPTDFRGVNVEKLLQSDILVIKVPVGDYICTVAYKGVLENLKSVLKRQPKPNVTLQSVIKAVTMSIDDTDLLVDCTCFDFKYRYAYWSSKYGYKYGEPETRPPKITNPDDNIGSMCKHLTALLSNKKWLVKIASTVNEYIKIYTDDVRKILKLSPDEFIVNKDYKIPKGSKFNKSTGKYELPSDNKKSNSQDSTNLELNPDEDNSEELEINNNEEEV